ncbi:MAG: discoidin domain-containing protein [Leptonema sp. (in: bacteria)]
MSIRISHPYVYSFQNLRISSGQYTLDENNYLESYISEKKDSFSTEYLIASFDELIYFNQLKISSNSHAPKLAPTTFRFEISLDGEIWEPILKEASFGFPTEGEYNWNFSLLQAKYIKFICFNTNYQNIYQVAIGKLHVCISGIVDIKVSSQLDRLWVKENLIDQRQEYGWSSALKKEDTPEFIEFDLGSINRVNEIRMLSKNQKETFFPISFRFVYSDDGITWHHLLEENGFFAEPKTWYRWRFFPVNMRYIKILITENAITREGKYVSQIIEVEFYADSDALEKGSKAFGFGSIPYASVLRSGIVRLAFDGESKEGKVVQSNDGRLKEATTESKGIVELASDGEDREGVVVQGNDRRLKYASEDLPGIVCFARNREEKALYAVQSNDERLKPATTQSKGIVELAEDGEDREGVVVQGNDRRLKYATTNSYGIVKLAKLGESIPNLVVQSNDPRLREATTEYKGIVRLAKLGEENSDCVVVANDPRLKPATTQTKGIVELAEDGEDREGVVVQGNDRRLKYATTNSYGIVRLCPKGESVSETVVQGDDPRLSDARNPLPHEHNYALKEHEFNSHIGMLKIERETGTHYEECLPPDFTYSPIIGVNTGEGSGISGKGKIRGILGYGEKEGVTGFSEQGTGVVGKTMQGIGGSFFSERNLDLILGISSSDFDDFLNNKKEFVSKNSFFVSGKSYFLNSIFLDSLNSKQLPVIAMYMPVKEKEIFLPGDLVIASTKAGYVQKCHHKKSNKVIGVVVESASIILNSDVSKEIKNTLDKEKILVALFGIVPVRVYTEKIIVEPGDILMSSFQSGCAEKYFGDFEMGTVVGKSLGTVKKGIETIPVLLTW